MSLLPYHEARLAAALECNADLNRAYFAKSLELDKVKADLVEVVAAILKGRTNVTVMDCIAEYHRLRWEQP